MKGGIPLDKLVNVILFIITAMMTILDYFGFHILPLLLPYS